MGIDYKYYDFQQTNKNVTKVVSITGPERARLKEWQRSSQ